MKISIDFDGTLTRYPEFFSAMMRAMQKDGHCVGILTGHHHEFRQADYDWLKCKGFPIPDFWIGREPTSDPRTFIHKLSAMREHSINFHFDDCDSSDIVTVHAMREFPNVICVR